MDKSENLMPNYETKNLFLFVCASLVVLLFVILGVFLKDSIFFGYDMPRVALKVQDFLSNGSYIYSQYFFSESTWQNVAWGPALIFFYSVLIKITPDPILISIILTIVNVIGIISIIVLGWRFFSPSVGIFVGALLAFNPYWFTYLRIIYQPSPLTLLLPIAMLLHFYCIKQKSIALILTPVVWVAMFQIYIPSLAYTVTSALFLLFSLKKKTYKFMIIGAILSGFLLAPSIRFYYDNPFYISRFFNAPSYFTPREKNFLERSKKVSISFIQVPVGGMFGWQTGSSNDNFINNYMVVYPIVSFVLTLIFVTSLIYELYYSIRFKELNRGVVVAWSVTTFWYLIVLWTTDLPPRYFLISIPASLLLISIFFSDLYKILIKFGRISFVAVVIPILIILYWVIFNIDYNFFIKNDSYSKGRYNDVAETPYIHFKNAMDWADNDAKKSGCSEYSITNNKSELNYDIWMETKYVWEYIYKYKYMNKDNINENCSYLLEYEYTAKSLNIINYNKFGPFVVFKYYTN